MMSRAPSAIVAFMTIEQRTGDYEDYQGDNGAPVFDLAGVKLAGHGGD